jgi:mannose-6-phosphate isomerase
LDRTTHRLCAVGGKRVRVLEISFGEFDEEDIVRLEDAYGRAG